MSYFDGLDGGSTVDTVTAPKQIFHALPSKSAKYEYLRDVQGDVLEGWYAKRDQRDTVIKMNTGGGKTVVGLIGLKSCLNESKGPAVYVAPDHYLCDQVIKEAKDLGIETVTDPRSPHYLSGRAILVIPIHTVFNGRSKFGVSPEGAKIPIGSIVIDDAHACLSIAEKQFTIQVGRDSDVWDGLFKIFKPDIALQSTTSAAEIERGDPRALIKIPFWAWADKLDRVTALLVDHRDDPELEWSWPLLRDVLGQCACFMSARGLEITPHCLPTDAVSSFAQAKRRIYMTATLADDSVLVTNFDADPNAITVPIVPKGGSDIGERLILVPQEINPDVTDEEIRALVAGYAKKTNVVVVVPSFERAKFWESVATLTINSENIAEGVSKLRASSKNLAVMVNRYDGVDLPNDACRVLVVDGLPDSRSLKDRREQGLLETTRRYSARQVQKIEQGMGRGIRASHDYCVVILMGAQLLSTLYAAGAASYFSDATSKQLGLSRKLAKQLDGKGITEMSKVIDGALARDSQWVSAAKNALIDVSNPSTVTVDAISVAQRASFEAARRGRYEKAEASLRIGLNDADSPAVEGWLLEQVAEVVHHLDKVRAQSVLAGAHDRNMLTTRPQGGITYARVDTVGLDQARQAAEFLRTQYGDGNAIVLGTNAILDHLHFGPDNAENFEQALMQLGRHLGFRTQRPEKLGIAGLDVLWGIGERRYLLLPCKSEATSTTISKDYADQVSGSATWFEGAYDHTCHAVPVIVHPSTQLDKFASAPAETRVMNEEKLGALKKAALAFVVAAKDNLEGGTQNIRALLSAERLLGNQLLDRFTLPVKKAH